MFFDKCSVYETVSRTRINENRNIGDGEVRQENKRSERIGIGKSGRVETKLLESTVRFNATPRLCVRGVAL